MAHDTRLALEVDVSDVEKVAKSFFQMERELKRSNRPLEVGQTNAIAHEAYSLIVKQHGNKIAKYIASRAPKHIWGRLKEPRNYIFGFNKGGTQSPLSPMLVIYMHKSTGRFPGLEGLPSWVHDGTKERFTSDGFSTGKITPNPWLTRAMGPAQRAELARQYEVHWNRIMAKKFDSMKGITTSGTKARAEVATKPPPTSTPIKSGTKNVGEAVKKQEKPSAPTPKTSKHKPRSELPGRVAETTPALEEYFRRPTASGAPISPAGVRKRRERHFKKVQKPTASGAAPARSTLYARFDREQAAAEKYLASSPRKATYGGKTGPRSARSGRRDRAQVRKQGYRTPDRRTKQGQKTHRQLTEPRKTTYGGKTGPRSARSGRRDRAQVRKQGFITPDRRTSEGRAEYKSLISSQYVPLDKTQVSLVENKGYRGGR